MTISKRSSGITFDPVEFVAGVAPGVAVDPVRLREIAAELQAASDADATAAATAITGMAELPSGHLLAIASYAARAL